MAQPTSLEASLGALIMTFHKKSLSTKSVLGQKCNTNQAPEDWSAQACESTKGSPEVDDLMTMLDQDADGSVDFKEYITLIGSLAYACNCALVRSM
ncbi:protein S100-A1-like [Oncorhynchus nerka]|uniref:protein S100-A1-like n=1 Tax=Oncorhynchus nerka TaxID=8023 RepID=UPI0031B8407B